MEKMSKKRIVALVFMVIISIAIGIYINRFVFLTLARVWGW